MQNSPRERLASAVTRAAESGQLDTILDDALLASSTHLHQAAMRDPSLIPLIGQFHWLRYRAGGLSLDLGAALTMFSTVHNRAVVPVELRVPAKVLAESGMAPHRVNDHVVELMRRPGATADMTVLEPSILLLHWLSSVLAADEPLRGRVLTNLSLALTYRHMLTGAVEDLNSAVSAASEAVATASWNDENRPGRVANLIGVLLERFTSRGDPADLDAAISAGQASVRDDEWESNNLHHNLGRAHLHRYHISYDISDLRASQGHARRALTMTPAPNRFTPSFALQLALSSYAAYLSTGQTQDMEAAIEEHRAALMTNPGSSALRACLCHLLTDRFARTAAPADLDEAIDVGQRALRSDPTDLATRRTLFQSLGSAFRSRYDLAAGPADLDEAVEYARLWVDASPGTDNFLVALANHATRLELRYGLSRSRCDLDVAIEAARAAFDATPPEDARRVRRAGKLIAMLMTRSRDFGTREEGKAAEVGAEFVGRADTDGQDGRMLVVNVAVATLEAFRARPSAAGRDRTIAALRWAIERKPGDAQLPTMHHDLASLLVERHEETHEPDDLKAAKHALRQAQQTPALDPDLCVTIGTTSFKIFHYTADQADLDLAEEMYLEVDRAFQSGESSSRVKGQLAIFYLARFIHGGASEDLEKSITFSRAAMAAAEGNFPLTVLHASQLGASLRLRQELDGDRAWLAESLALLREVERVCAPDDPGLAFLLPSLGLSLLARYEYEGDVGSLAEAEDVLYRAVALPEAGTEPAIYSNLGIVLHTRYENSGDLADLEAAIRANRKAVQAATDALGVPLLRSNLANSLRRRYERLRSVSDLQEAVALGEQALAACPAGRPERSNFLTNLSNAYRDLVEAAPEAPVAGRAMDRAVELDLEATNASDGYPHARRLSNLAVSYRLRYLYRADVADHQRAVEVAKRAAELLNERDPSKAMTLYNIGELLELKGDREVSTEAEQSYKLSATMEYGAPLYRIMSATAWARLARQRGDVDTTWAAYRIALTTLPRLTGRAVGRQSQQFHLRAFGGIASAAAATALDLGRLPDAVSVLEQARGVLIGQALQLSQIDASLQATHPDLAARLDRVRAELGGGEPREDLILGEGVPNIGWSRRQRVEQWDRLLTEIRAQPGFEDYLQPSAVEELQAICTDGPVVFVNVAPSRCDALIIERNQIRSLRLACSLEEVDRQAKILHNATHADVSQDAVQGVLTWLWDSIAGPVLDRLGFSPTAAGEQTARVWWIPTGPLSTMPMHAAGYHDAANGRTVLDRVVSSYLPTMKVLQHVKRGQPSVPGRAVVVGCGDDLPNAAAECRAVADRLDGEVVVLTDERACKGPVLSALRWASVAHFACHGVSRSDPSESYLVVRDGRLTVHDLANLRLDATVVYLSACTTAYSGTRIADESIHLATAFQLSGFRHAIGTLWPVGDRIARIIATSTYDAMRHSVPPATALHRATVAVRRGRESVPALWAGHVHIGP